MAGFVAVPKVVAGIHLDGVLDEEAWKKAPVQILDQAEQFYAFHNPDQAPQTWEGPDDLSAEIRFLWDENFLYVSVKVRDDIAGKKEFQDSELWRMDGLQFLIDPKRDSKEKPGKYEYSIAEGKKGVQTWCALSCDAGAPPGDVKDIRVAIKHGAEGRGDRVYEIGMQEFEAVMKAGC